MYRAEFAISAPYADDYELSLLMERMDELTSEAWKFRIDNFVAGIIDKKDGDHKNPSQPKQRFFFAIDLNQGGVVASNTEEARTQVKRLINEGEYTLTLISADKERT